MYTWLITNYNQGQSIHRVAPKSSDNKTNVDTKYNTVHLCFLLHVHCMLINHLLTLNFFVIFYDQLVYA